MRNAFIHISISDSTRNVPAYNSNNGVIWSEGTTGISLANSLSGSIECANFAVYNEVGSATILEEACTMTVGNCLLVEPLKLVWCASAILLVSSPTWKIENDLKLIFGMQFEFFVRNLKFKGSHSPETLALTPPPTKVLPTAIGRTRFVHTKGVRKPIRQMSCWIRAALYWGWLIIT